MRQRGSVRFAPYYKLQWWDERALAWHDVQRAFSAPGAATAAIGTPEAPAPARAQRWRLMEISERGRAPLTELAPPSR
jgi:hypothetical protein